LPPTCQFTENAGLLVFQDLWMFNKRTYSYTEKNNDVEEYLKSNSCKPAKRMFSLFRI
jgi:hypothetical protein